MIAAAVYAVETGEFRNAVYSLALLGLGVSVYQLTAGAFLPGALQLISVFVLIYVLNRTLLPKASPREFAEGEYFSRAVFLIFMILSVILACGVSDAIAPNSYSPYLLSFVLILTGFFSVAFKKDIKKIVAGIVIIEYAVEAFLTLSGERQGITPLIGILAIVLLAVIAARLSDRLGTTDVTKIRELRG